MRRAIETGLALFDRLFMAAAQVSVFVMMLTVSADALGRYLFNAPLQGTYEAVSLYMMVIVAFLALPGTYAAGGHIRLDLLRPVLSDLAGNASERINSAVAAGVFGFLAWHAGHEAFESFAQGRRTFGSIQWPLYWSYVWVPLGCGLLALRLGVEVIWPRTDGDAL